MSLFPCPALIARINMKGPFDDFINDLSLAPETLEPQESESTKADEALSIIAEQPPLTVFQPGD